MRTILTMLVLVCMGCEVHNYPAPYEDQHYYNDNHSTYEEEWCHYEPAPYAYLQPVTCYTHLDGYFEDCCVYTMYNDWCYNGYEYEHWCYSAYTCEWELAELNCY